jgi:hypothetical protein
MLRYKLASLILLFLVQSSVAVNSRLTFGFESSRTYFYNLNYSSKSISDLSSLLASASEEESKIAQEGIKKRYDTNISTQIVVTVIDRTKDHIQVSYKFKNPQVSVRSDNRLLTKDVKVIGDELQYETFATLSPQGRVLSLVMRPEAGRLSRSFLKAILGSIQFVMPLAESQKSWEIKEDDPNGEYLAKYSVTGPGSIEKEKIKYLEAVKKENNLQIHKSTNGLFKASYSQELKLVRSIKGTETQQVTIDGKKVSEAEISLDLSFVKSERLASAEIAKLRNHLRTAKSTPLPLSAPETEEEIERDIHTNELGVETFNSLAKKLTSLDETKKEEHTSLYLKFKALLFLHPEESARVGELLSQTKSGSAQMILLSGALGSIGHKEAQIALANAIKSTKDTQALLILLPTLGMVPSPVLEAEQVIKALAFGHNDCEIQNTAKLCLGVLVRNLQKESPVRADSIVDEVLLNRSTKCADSTKQTILFLGNVGSLKALTTIEKYLNDPDAKIRAYAIYSLRRVNSPKVESYLLNALLGDSDSSVRNRAAFSLRFRQPDNRIFESHVQAFKSDDSTSVKMELLRNFMEWRKQFPEGFEIVKKTAIGHESEELRKTAESLLNEL